MSSCVMHTRRDTCNAGIFTINSRRNRRAKKYEKRVRVRSHIQISCVRENHSSFVNPLRNLWVCLQDNLLRLLLLIYTFIWSIYIYFFSFVCRLFYFFTFTLFSLWCTNSAAAADARLVYKLAYIFLYILFVFFAIVLDMRCASYGDLCVVWGIC